MDVCKQQLLNESDEQGGRNVTLPSRSHVPKGLAVVICRR
jgi:hypothetical protein